VHHSGTVEYSTRAAGTRHFYFRLIP
jgi:hypothetical protein